MGMYLVTLIKSVGYIGVFATIFAETGILFGIFLPGDMLLFTIGVLASQHYFDITWLVTGCFFAAVFGNMLGYEIGRRLGLPFLNKHSRRYVTDERLQKTQAFFNRYGRSSIVLARFVPVARTLAPFMAGISRMNYRVFVTYSVIGGALWAAGLPTAGYYLAGRVPPELVDNILLPVVFLFAAVMLWMGARRHRS